MNLCQFFTPLWVAEALLERHFPKLDCADCVIEPSCGQGNFLLAVPRSVPAIGIEIDEAVAAVAREQTGREIIVGDFRTVALTVEPTAIIGNPPFRAGVFDGFLDRAYELLPEGAKAGFILPTYFFQTAGRVWRYAERWSITSELIPRNAFHTRMHTPLLFALFSKDAKRIMVGFALYDEADALTRMARPYRKLLAAQQGSAWKAVCQLALTRLGGEAELLQIYKELERNRPTHTCWWREKIRQTLRVYRDAFRPIGAGRYALRST